jgi:hypothetical protein
MRLMCGELEMTMLMMMRCAYGCAGGEVLYDVMHLGPDGLVNSCVLLKAALPCAHGVWGAMHRLLCKEMKWMGRLGACALGSPGGTNQLQLFLSDHRAVCVQEWQV